MGRFKFKIVSICEILVPHAFMLSNLSLQCENESAPFLSSVNNVIRDSIFVGMDNGLWTSKNALNNEWIL